MTNRVKYGLKNVHAAVWDDDSETYDTPFAIKGAVSMTVDPDGSSTNFAADNNPKYAVLNVNSGYTGELEIAVLEDDARIALLGEVQDDNGMLIEDASVSSFPSFALMFEIDGNVTAKRYCLYNVTCERPSLSANTTTESTDPDTDTLPFTAGSRELETTSGTVEVVKTAIDESQDAYETWYEAVTLPTVA